MTDATSMLTGTELLRSRLSEDDASALRLRCGYTDPLSDSFVRECEFISLGCYCTVAQAFAYLGVRRRAYPFDWTRSPMEGIIHCIQTDFEDFLTYTTTREENGHKVFSGSRWGGSFWHADLEDSSVQSSMQRRVERFVSCLEVAASKPRMFVRVINSTRELDLALKLKETLTKVFPHSPIYLLLIIDLQESKGPVCLEGVDGHGIMFYFLDAETVYKSGLSGPDDYQARSKAYAEVIAFASRYWAGRAEDCAAITTFPTLSQVSASCEQYFGGDPSNDLYSPQHFKGHKLNLKSNTKANLPHLIHGRNAEFPLPDGVVPGGVLKVNIFGTDLFLKLPSNAAPGQLMKCRLADGVVSAAIVVSAALASSSIATTAASLAGQNLVSF
eukprot:TRINITY_DN32499_c0_g1_i1.p1 TRINITY_DN32499_c0_g1~~TRINITY_DN32499_c0_g1_i1.p1  ORF type:complete len:386 (-),score=53.74 TRINITY_DN32499_c0_g1_i1:156-1313(-)